MKPELGGGSPGASPPSHAGERLRRLLEGDRIVIAPGAYDAWSARLTERAGFPAVYMTGFGAAASFLGVPDLGLMTATEMAAQAARIAGAVALPVIGDADTGFGEILNIRRTVRLYEDAGVAAIQLEDQVTPKRCGHMENKQVVDTGHMARRIKAALDARRDDRTMIIARTDARAVHGLDEALRRGETYLAAGADILFIEAPRDDGELRKIGAAFRGVPLLANVVEAGKTPYRSAEELREMGFSIAIFPISTLLAATRAVMDALGEISRNGKLAGGTPIVGFEEFNRLMGLQGFLRAADIPEKEV